MKGSKQAKRLKVRQNQARTGPAFTLPGSLNTHKSQSVQTKARQFRKRKTR